MAEAVQSATPPAALEQTLGDGAFPTGKLHVTHDKDAYWDPGLREYFEYRDLGMVGPTGGSVRAHVIRPQRLRKPGDTALPRAGFPDGLRAQGLGARVVRGASARCASSRARACTRSRALVHRVLEYSDDYTVIEITMPADFERSRSHHRNTGCNERRSEMPGRTHEARLSRRTLLQGTTATRSRLLRAVEAQPCLGAEDRQADPDRPHPRRQRPVRAIPARMRCAARSWRSRRSTPRAACSAASSTYIHADTETTPATGTRVAERMITRNEVALPRRRHPVGRGQRHRAGRAEIRRRLLQHQLELAHRGGQGLPPRQVRVGRQRRRTSPIAARQGAIKTFGKNWLLLHQRLCLGPQHLQGDARGRTPSSAPR